MELASILDPGRPPKMDKTVLLVDAVRMVTQLRDEAQKLKESNENLLGKISELKVCFNCVLGYSSHIIEYNVNAALAIKPIEWDRISTK